MQTSFCVHLLLQAMALGESQRLLMMRDALGRRFDTRLMMER
jgi:hypothetical protein